MYYGSEVGAAANLGAAKPVGVAIEASQDDRINSGAARERRRLRSADDPKKRLAARQRRGRPRGTRVGRAPSRKRPPIGGSCHACNEWAMLYRPGRRRGAPQAPAPDAPRLSRGQTLRRHGQPHRCQGGQPPVIVFAVKPRTRTATRKRCSSERGEREKRFYGDGKGERRRTAF